MMLISGLMIVTVIGYDNFCVTLPDDVWQMSY